MGAKKTASRSLMVSLRLRGLFSILTTTASTELSQGNLLKFLEDLE